jgi:hypothetical protein
VITIISVLSGAFGSLEVKFLVTTTVVALASICALACSTYPNHVIGSLGICIAILAACMLIAGVWLEVNADFYWRFSAILAVIAVAFAHSLALLSIPLVGYSWLKTTTLVSIFTLAILLSYLFIVEFDQAPSRLLTVLSILVTLQTVIIPVLAKIKKSDATRREKLILIRQSNGNYQSSDGRYFKVTEISKTYTES